MMIVKHEATHEMYSPKTETQYRVKNLGSLWTRASKLPIHILKYIYILYNRERMREEKERGEREI